MIPEYISDLFEKAFWFSITVWCILVLAILILLGAMAYSNKETQIRIPLGVFKVTCYKATTQECDSTPDIGAYGRVARNGIPTGRWFANNRLPKGTKIVIPSLTGDTVWECRDKMSPRFSGDYIDLLITPGSISYGIKEAKVYIVLKGAE